MYKRRIGIGAGLISYVTLLAGRGGNRRAPSSPHLIIDFVGPSAAGVSLNAEFTAGQTGTYETYTADASQPQAGFINIQVWS